MCRGVIMKNKQYPFYNVPNVLNFREYLSHCEKDYNNNIAFSFHRNKALIKKSYIDFSNEVKALASELIVRGYNKRTVAVMGENSYEWILTYFGVVTSGNIIVPIDKELSVEAVKGILKETKATAFFCSETYDDYALEVKKTAPNISVMFLKKDVAALLDSGKKHSDNTFASVEIEPDDLAAIIYTSGTTGIPKGVMLTHRNICSNYYGGRQNLKVRGKSILVLPLHHTYAFTGAILCVMGCGTEIYINSSLKNIINDMNEIKPHIITLVPVMLEMFHKKIWETAQDSGKNKILKKMITISNLLLCLGIDLRRKIFKSVLNGFGGNLEIIICGGAPLDEKYVRDFRAFGIQIIQGYGITECSPMLAVMRNYYFKDDSVGLMLPNMDIKINKFENSVEGEILAKGDSVMKGYFNNPELTAKAFDEEGYFKTGDIGYVDNDGFVYVTGRMKNMIVLANGKNVYPEELEFELLKNKAIKEILVYDKDNEIVGEIYPDSQKLAELSIEDAQKYFEEYVAEFNKTQPMYKNINKVVLRNTEFSKTTSMKIKRNYN